MHAAKHPLAGKHVRLRGRDVPTTPYLVGDWLDRTQFDSDIEAYASLKALNALWDETKIGDACVVVGRIGSLLIIAHHSELGPVEASFDPWADIETD